MNFRFNILIVAILILLCSCNNIRKEIELLSSRPIMLPDTLSNFYISKEEGHINSSIPLMKLIVYIDSSECASCSIKQIDEWNSIIDSVLKISDKINFYFILTPQKINLFSVKKTLIAEGFNYPVLLDTLGKFEKLNPHLPKNRALHTFLLDENNSVILAGSPLYNKRIEEMFYKIVEEKLGKSQQSSAKED